MEIKAANGNIVVKSIRLEEAFVQSATIVAVQEKEPELGEVVDVGQPAFRKKCPIPGLKKGDIVAYRKYGESKYIIGGSEYAIVDFQDILAIITGGKKK